MNPTRRSTWDDERFRAHTAGWGAFHDVCRELIERHASVLVTPASNYVELATRWTRALLDAYAGRAGVAEALESAAADVDALAAAAHR
jgi:multiple sugar transport system substrate-binding protein